MQPLSGLNWIGTRTLSYLDEAGTGLLLFLKVLRGLFKRPFPLRLSLEQPAAPGELRIFNQVTETFSVNELAERVQRVGKSLGYDVTIERIENPRVEKEEHYYNPTYTGLLDLGLEPHPLTDAVLRELFQIAERYRDRIDPETFFRGVKWK